MCLDPKGRDGSLLAKKLKEVMAEREEAESREQLPPLPYPCPTPEESDIYRRYKIKRFEFFLANICHKLILQV